LCDESLRLNPDASDVIALKRRIAEQRGGNSGSTSGSALASTHRYAQNSGLSSGRMSSTGTSSTSPRPTQTQTSSASGGWTGTYAAGTQKSLEIKGATYNFRYCPAGTFTMGSPENETGRNNDEGPQRRVELTKGFWILETEVTQAMWESVMGENPSWFSLSGDGSSMVHDLDTSNFPVERVSKYDCQEFIKELNSLGIVPSRFEFRLPTEAEWEYACRANSTGAYAGSNLDSLGWYGGNSNERTHEVGTKSPNGWGLCDMHGNVWEWCADRYDSDYYEATNSVHDPFNVIDGSGSVLRGGCWKLKAKECRSANRSDGGPTNQAHYTYGFRLVLGRELL
ncbi:MAG: formylglycine-generating enzyme family protein, partial [Thermoguttaceae bacterium]|nr:formylglycine-generating enzyme family protein [Thermoguttaceae bacterium]